MPLDEFRKRSIVDGDGFKLVLGGVGVIASESAGAGEIVVVLGLGGSAYCVVGVGLGVKLSVLGACSC